MWGMLVLMAVLGVLLSVLLGVEMSDGMCAGSAHADVCVALRVDACDV